jgi:two-component system cell cycle response regulator
VRSRAADQRWRSATYRAAAAAQRAQAAEDRRAAAEDRRLAADERAQAHADLNDMARELEIAATDPLTGARMRAAGLAELDHEIDRARRAGASLVAVYVDVVGLKAVNDSEGHLAGDTMLQRVVAVLKENVRSYDLIIRLGGDEFLCVLSDATLMDARRRLRHVGITLAADETPHQVTAGFAKLGPGETAAELIARADADLIDQRGAAH